MITPVVPRWCRIALCAAVLVACPRPAAAEWQFAPFFGWEFSGHTSLFDPELASDDMHRAFGIFVTRIGRSPLGFEGAAVFVPGYFNDPKRSGENDAVTGSNTYALMGNIVLAAPLEWNEYGLRPYVSGGFGILRASKELIGGSEGFSTSDTWFGANVGGGAIGFLGERTGIRFDLRFFTNVRNLTNDETLTVGTPRSHLRYWSGSIGLVLR